MPLYMENALTVTPTARRRRRPTKLAPINRQSILKKQALYKGVPLRPMESRVFTKLYENSHRLLDGKQKTTSCKERLPSTPVDVDISKAPTCCRHYWEVYQESQRHLVDAVLPYHDPISPPRPAADVLLRRRSPDQLTKCVEKDMDYNSKQLPLSTILVRWKHFRDKHDHNIISIFDELRTYGPIDNIQMTSQVSARVTFHQLDSACRAVAQRFVGPLEHPITCSWYHRSMLIKAFYIRRRHLHVVYNPFTSERIEQISNAK